jgi:hypothetical protein
MTNKMQLCWIIYYSVPALHVSSDIFFHHQKHLNCITASGITHLCRCQLTPHPHLVPWLRKCGAMPVLHLWAVQPVHSLSACTKLRFALLYMTKKSIPFHCPLLHVILFLCLFSFIIEGYGNSLSQQPQNPFSSFPMI